MFVDESEEGDVFAWMVYIRLALPNSGANDSSPTQLQILTHSRLTKIYEYLVG